LIAETTKIFVNIYQHLFRIISAKGQGHLQIGAQKQGCVGYNEKTDRIPAAIDLNRVRLYHRTRDRETFLSIWRHHDRLNTHDKPVNTPVLRPMASKASPKITTENEVGFEDSFKLSG
jgi:hypothetical protein